MVYVILHETSGEIGDKEEGYNNDPKDGEGSKKKENVLESETSIRNFLNIDKQDIENAKHFEYEFLTSRHIKKIKW